MKHWVKPRWFNRVKYFDSGYFLLQHQTATQTHFYSQRCLIKVYKNPNVFRKPQRFYFQTERRAGWELQAPILWQWTYTCAFWISLRPMYYFDQCFMEIPSTTLMEKAWLRPSHSHILIFWSSNIFNGRFPTHKKYKATNIRCICRLGFSLPVKLSANHDTPAAPKFVGMFKLWYKPNTSETGWSGSS